MSSIPRNILYGVVIVLGGVALFGLVSGFTSSFGRGGFNRAEVPAAATGGVVVDAQPLSELPPPPPPPAPPEKTEAELAAEAAEAAKEAAAKAAAMPKAPEAYVPPVQLAPPPEPAPPPAATPGVGVPADGPVLY
jgi:hypothetical protein